MKTQILTSLVIAALSGASALAEDPANGHNVHMVTYNIPQGTGTFFQDGPQSWRENAANGSLFHFAENARDDWSVYLHDPSRNVSLQLDLHTRKITYSDAAQRFELYEIASASSKVNGRVGNLVQLANSGGYAVEYMRQQAGRNWITAGQFETTLVETGRDDWSVYLEDPVRHDRFQIDFHTGRVSMNGQPQPIYTIKDAGVIIPTGPRFWDWRMP